MALPTTVFLVWVVAAGAAQAATAITDWLVVLPVVLAAVAVVSTVVASGTARVLCGCVTLTAAAVPFAPAYAWVAAAVAAVALLNLPVSDADGEDISDLERHLSSCRRSGAPAYVLVATVGNDAHANARAVRGVFRLTDTVQVMREGSAYTVRGVLDGEDCSPEGLEQRLHLSFGRDVSIGWARFPGDGVTLDALMDRARSEAGGPGASESVGEMA